MNETLLDMLITMGIGMMPILEIRGAIPIGVGALGLDPFTAFCAALAGNLLAVIILLTFLDPVTRILMKHSKWFNRFLTKLFHKTRHKHSERFNELGALFLLTFVAVPLPVTGAWTGSLIAFLFGVRFWPAFLLISTGVTIAGLLISFGVESITELIEWLS